ncbi:MAG: phospholipase D-like domain-containing protein, partial [Chloroflexota bacterium]|nr:phospholipase D-like domain-containing protein [Chloroflexota bacterium]
MTSDNAPVPVANDRSTGSMQDHLLEALQRVLPREVRIATAYFTPDGFLGLRSALEGAQTVHLLLGERPFLNRRGPGDVLTQPGEQDELQGPAESVDWYTFLEGGYPWLLLSHEERAELLRRGLDPSKDPFDLSAWERVRILVDFLRKNGVEVRRFLGNDVEKVVPGKVLDYRSPTRLHAKAYLFTGDLSSYAAVGSSNLTKSGLMGNAELNLASYDPSLVQHLEDWFDGKWSQGQDCKDEFIQRLEECVLFGRRFSPWQVMLKSLHAAYGRFLEIGLSEDLAERLAGFQQHAVLRCLPLLSRHWGAMLCDSVGLGKTYEGLGILAEFSRRRETRTRALVVCPAQLQDNWRA